MTRPAEEIAKEFCSEQWHRGYMKSMSLHYREELEKLIASLILADRKELEELAEQMAGALLEILNDIKSEFYPDDRIHKWSSLEEARRTLALWNGRKKGGDA